MRYAKVYAGAVIKVGLPESGELSDGRTVSNYPALSEEVLAAEGWLPLVDDPPVFDPKIDVRVSNGYTITAVDVTALYIVSPRPPEDIVAEVNVSTRTTKILGAKARALQIVALAQTPGARTTTAWTQPQRVAILDAIGDMAKMLSWLADQSLGNTESTV